MILAIYEGSKTNRTEHAQGIVVDAYFGIADEANEKFFYIGFSSKWIVEFVRNRIKVECVDGEIASLCVCFPVAEADGVWMATVGGGIFFAEGGDFEDVFSHWHASAAEDGRKAAGLWEDCLNFLGSCLGAYVDIFRDMPTQHFPNGASYPPGVESGICEVFDDAIGRFSVGGGEGLGGDGFGDGHIVMIMRSLNEHERKNSPLPCGGEGLGVRVTRYGDGPCLEDLSTKCRNLVFLFGL